MEIEEKLLEEIMETKQEIKDIEFKVDKLIINNNKLEKEIKELQESYDMAMVENNRLREMCNNLDKRELEKKEDEK